MPRFDLETTFLGLSGDGEVTQMPVGPDFWPTMDRNPNMRATLVSFGTGEGDWPHWEMHPKGDEVLVLVEGSLTLILDEAGVERRQDMTAGQTLVVPKGAWHRAIGQRGVKMLFITYGEGTQHRPVAA
ncbi:MAG: cupin domain-containing protein [Caulobacteraceae bacterium]